MIKIDYFKNWSHNMAYVYGLYLAKGYSTYDGTFNITLPKKDKFLLKMVAQEIGYEGGFECAKSKQKCSIHFQSEEFVNNRPKSDVPKDFVPDVMRGYFDGCGNFTQIKRKRTNTLIQGNTSFLLALLPYLKEQAGIEGGRIDPIKECLHLGTKDTIKFGQYIYSSESNLFLKRKKDKFDNIKNKER